MTRILSLGAYVPLLYQIFGKRHQREPDMAEVKRRLRIDLADFPEYLKRDIGLNDD